MIDKIKEQVKRIQKASGMGYSWCARALACEIVLNRLDDEEALPELEKLERAWLGREVDCAEDIQRAIFAVWMSTEESVLDEIKNSVETLLAQV